MADTLDSKPSAKSMRVRVPPSAPSFELKDKMKFLFLATCLALCSCATGVSDPIEEPEEVYVAPPKKPAPPAPEPEPEDTTAVPQCVVDAYWVNDCYVVKIYCKDKPTRVEISCGPGRPLWPWEIIPDPPYDNRR